MGVTGKDPWAGSGRCTNLLGVYVAVVHVTLLFGLDKWVETSFMVQTLGGVLPT